MLSQNCSYYRIIATTFIAFSVLPSYQLVYLLYIYSLIGLYLYPASIKQILVQF
ncbi:hypothetical protein AG1IA_05324 [Rhizoctonia solani AG-1 IA]|uniref:Uncharacterized protein n=1 Tax=Thanatephorus cucumeris (strain AG1-IA) TaxID=983506 RepID=L8WWC2_THACA|nr:hypothetical protein AG1IA_05324 [Rhizoctonia solani AG-1 IA]